MKILLADSDTDLMELLAYVLLRLGHQVGTAPDGAQALQRWISEHSDLLVLDATLPKIDGFQVCTRVRTNSQVPIIMLSSRHSEQDLLRGFECGADDIILKPFSTRQLVLRIDSLMRRVKGPGNPPEIGEGTRVNVGDLHVDPIAFEVSKNGSRLTLTRLEFRILHFLARQAGRLVEIQRLAAYAWQSPGGGDATLLKTHVSHIRQKLALSGGTPLQIRAVPRTGYIFSGGETESGALGKAGPSDHIDEEHLTTDASLISN